jgi:ubiquinone/menaquinone biosynthesis C-methylase UbiE
MTRWCYVAADLSPVMLQRARAEAKRRDLDQIEFVEADVEALPFDDASFDLRVSHTGLHCFPDPAAAVSEIARVLRPGGAVRGTMVVRRAGLRRDAFVHLYQVAGVFGPSGTCEELESWLADAGMLAVITRSDGALAYFSARRDPEHA